MGAVKHRARRVRLVAGRLLGTVALLPAAHSQGLQVTPVGLELTLPQRASTVTVSHPGGAETAVQARAFSWTQVDGVDRLEPTAELRLSPPIATLAAGREQVVRAVYTGAGADFAAFRVLVDELPSDPGERRDAVRLLLRYSLPVFVRSVGATAPALSFSIGRGAGGAVLRVHNSGGSPARLSALAVHGQDEPLWPRQAGLLGYVLPGAWREWPLGAQVTSARSVEVTVNGRVARFELAAPP